MTGQRGRSPLIRRALDLLYRWSGGLAALCLVAICVVVLAQVGANLVNSAARAVTGQALGLSVPSYAEIAGLFLSAASFLALAATLRSGEHIRVFLVLDRLPGHGRRALGLLTCGAGATLAAYTAFQVAVMVRESWTYGDVTAGVVPVPLWLPQSVMAFGVLVFAVALVDEFYESLRGGTATPGAGGKG